MAILSNINGKFAVDSTGAIQFSGAAGTSGYVLKSTGSGTAPTWVDASTVIGGPYLPLSGGTLTGSTSTDTGISFTVGGTLLVGSGGYSYLNPKITVDTDTDAPISIVINNQQNGSSAEAKFVVSTYGNSWHVGMGSSTHTYGNDLTFTPDASTSNAPKLRIATSGNATFANEISAGDDINTTGKFFASATNAELRLKSTNNTTGTSLINFADPDDNDVGQIKYLHSNNEFQFRSTDALALTLDYDAATFAGTVTGGNGTFTNLTISATEKLRFDGAGGHTYIEEDSNDTLIFATGGTTRLTLDANATFAGQVIVNSNVGIGTTSPDAQLEIEKSASSALGPVMLLNNSAGGNSDKGAIIYASYGNTYQRAKIEFAVDSTITNNPANIQFYTGRSDLGTLTSKMTIAGDGNVGIGTNAPSTPLMVNRASNSNEPGIYYDVTGGGSGSVGIGSTAAFGPFIAGNTLPNGDVRGAYAGCRMLFNAGGFSFQTSDETSGARVWDNGMNIEIGGNVGIGTTSPSDYYADKFVVYDGDEGGMTIANSSTSGKSYLCFADGTSGAAAYAGYMAYDHNDNSMSFANDGGSNRLTITTGGNVGIGSTNPGALLEIAGSGDALRIESTNTGSGGAQVDLLHFTTSPADEDSFAIINGGGYYTGTTSVYGTQIKSIWTDVSERHSRFEFYTCDTSLSKALTIDHSNTITAVGDVVAYSDKKLKKNIKTLDGSKVYNMRGVSFDRVDTDKPSSGVIAQEIQKIAPELVNETDGTLGVAYGNLTGYLIEAIKELKAEIEELKQKSCNCK